MRTQKIYYAHSKQKYGTVPEVNEHAYLYNVFPKAMIVNPAHLEFKRMNQYLEEVANCNILVASEIDEHVGHGVFTEICRALSVGIPVYVLRRVDNKYKLLDVIGIEIQNPNDWEVEFAKLITKE